MTALFLEEDGRRKALAILLSVFHEFQPRDTACFYSVLAGEETFGGKWPECFLSEVSSIALAMMAAVAGNAKEEQMPAVVDHLLTASPSAWDEIVEQAVEKESYGMIDVLGLFLAAAFRYGKMPVPWLCSARPSKNDKWEERQADVEDPRRRITLRPARWLFASVRGTANAAVLLERFADCYSFSEKAQELCQEAARCEERIRGQVALWWEDFRLAACGEGQSIRRWVPADGLVRVMVEVAGCSSAETGVGPATFYGGHPFPSLAVKLEYLLFGELFSEDGVLGEGGLLSVVEDYPHGSAQRGLRLVQNFALVRELHRIAFAEGYCGGQQRNRGSGTRVGANRAVSAHLAHFRRIDHLKRRDGTPWQPSEEALERVPPSLIVPPGHTYVSSPPLHSREAHPDIKPLVIEAAVGEEVCRG